MFKIEKIRYFLFSWGPMILWMTIIFAFSSRQRIQISHELVINFIFFKSLHVIEYAILYIFTFRGFYSLKNISRKKAAIYSFTVSFLYAIVDEVHQTFVPTREGTLRDIMIDFIGISLAFIIINRYFDKIKKLIFK